MWAETDWVMAPARVNLLGEHTDYTGGYVMPMAIPFETRASIMRSGDELYRFKSGLFTGERVMDSFNRETRMGTWSDYPVGVLRELQALDIHPKGFVLELTGNVPFGAGLSSSASVEIASCLAMLKLSGVTMTTAEVAKLCQRAENKYVGSPCGIMDQFVIAAGRRNHALLLNTRDLTYDLVPMDAGNLASTCVVVCNSGVKHSVAAGDYGVRRKEAEEAQEAIRAAFSGVRDLGDATIAMLDHVAAQISKSAYKRAHHIVSENTRVLKAKDAMRDGDARAMGELMIEAHASQRDDFECSCDEIDFLVDEAIGLDGCFGARMTGGGFGGCTVNLVARSKAEAFQKALSQAYQEKFGIRAEIWICDAVDGAMARNGLLGADR